MDVSSPVNLGATYKMRDIYIVHTISTSKSVVIYSKSIYDVTRPPVNGGKELAPVPMDCERKLLCNDV